MHQPARRRRKKEGKKEIRKKEKTQGKKDRKQTDRQTGGVTPKRKTEHRKKDD